MPISKLAGLRFRRLALAVAILVVAVLSDPSAKTNNQPVSAARHGANVMAVYGADAVTIDRSARDYKLPDQIDWKGRAGSANQSALLFGDPSTPGVSVQLLRRGPNDWAKPHSHPYDRVITVLAGTMLIGTGDNFDRNNTVALGPGSVIRDFANKTHFDGSGPDGMTIEIVNMPRAAAPEAK